MTESTSTGMNETKSVINTSLKVGLYTGSLVLGLPVLIYLLFCAIFWMRAIFYNGALFQISILQFLAIILVGSYIVAHSLCTDSELTIQNDSDARKAGLLAALAGNVWLVLCFFVVECINSLWNPYGEYYTIPLIGLFLVIFVIIVVIQVLTTWVVFNRSNIFGRPLNTVPPSNKGFCFSGSPYRNLCILIALLIIIPVGMSFGVVRMDLIEPESTYHGCCILHPHSLGVTRIDSDTIAIRSTIENMNPYVQNPFKDPVPGFEKPRFIILYNSKDISNQAIIDSQGLSVTIDPPDGLRYQEGDGGAILKGSFVSNVSQSGHIQIFDINPNEWPPNYRNYTRIDKVV